MNDDMRGSRISLHPFSGEGCVYTWTMQSLNGAIQDTYIITTTSTGKGCESTFVANQYEGNNSKLFIDEVGAIVGYECRLKSAPLRRKLCENAESRTLSIPSLKNRPVRCCNPNGKLITDFLLQESDAPMRRFRFPLPRIGSVGKKHASAAWPNLTAPRSSRRRGR